MKRTELPNGWHMVDDREVANERVEEIPASFPFPRSPRMDEGTDVEDVLNAAEDVCRRMEVLARELDCFTHDSGDDEGPRAA